VEYSKRHFQKNKKQLFSSAARCSGASRAGQRDALYFEEKPLSRDPDASMDNIHDRKAALGGAGMLASRLEKMQSRRLSLTFMPLPSCR
jgi:hypothetical protein